MDRIEKFLRSLSKSEAKIMQLLLKQIISDYRSVPDLKPLKGHKNMYRIRVGKYRIIIKIVERQVLIVKIGKRSESTYKDL